MAERQKGAGGKGKGRRQNEVKNVKGRRTKDKEGWV
jgi:hypothetical protein